MVRNYQLDPKGKFKSIKTAQDKEVLKIEKVQLHNFALFSLIATRESRAEPEKLYLARIVYGGLLSYPPWRDTSKMSFEKSSEDTVFLVAYLDQPYDGKTNRFYRYQYFHLENITGQQHGKLVEVAQGSRRVFTLDDTVTVESIKDSLMKWGIEWNPKNV